MDDPDQGFAAAVEFPTDANVTRAIIGLVRARDVHLTASAAGFVAADGNFSILNGGAGPVLANGSVTIRNGGCGPLVAVTRFSVAVEKAIAKSPLPFE